jgi:hypothetical protein
MKLRLIVAASVLLGAVSASAQPVEPESDLMERLSIDQVMRLSTMSPARISEMRCAGLGQWLVRNRPDGAKSPTRAAADRLSAEVQAAIANDAELPADIAGELVAAVALEAEGKAKEEPAAFDTEVETCAPLYAAAASSGPIKLHPLAAASVVSPALASCYAQYRLAASLSEGDEVGDLKANADRARELALRGKDGDVRAAAEAELEAEFLATAAAPRGEQEAGMMRLIMCQPMMASAARENAK